MPSCHPFLWELVRLHGTPRVEMALSNMTAKVEFFAKQIAPEEIHINISL